MFSKISQLAKLPIEAIFVFDGDKKPSTKRGTQTVNREHFLYKGMTLFIQAFGFEHRTVSFFYYILLTRVPTR
jgi:hypothetical protein